MRSKNPRKREIAKIYMKVRLVSNSTGVLKPLGHVRGIFHMRAGGNHAEFLTRGLCHVGF